MANFAIKDLPGRLQMADIGKRWHVGLGVPSTLQPTQLNMYGYNLSRKDAGGGDWIEKSDTKSRDQLSSTGSPNVTDRDFAPIPRVTDGDFSGGALQQIFIDPKRFYDSDLEIRVPGNLTLRAAWVRKDLGASAGSTALSAIVQFNSDAYVSYFDASKAIYYSTGTLTAPYATTDMSSDGLYLWGCDQSGNLWRMDSSNVFTSYAAAAPTGASNLWCVNLGTGGLFLYFSDSLQNLWRAPVVGGAPGASVQVPLGGRLGVPYDLVEYGSGVAILLNDVNRAEMRVVFHDGQNSSLMFKMRGYQGSGLCDALGDLYVAASTLRTGGASGYLEPPVLIRASQGSFDIVARIGSQLSSASVSSFPGAPIASGQYVAFPVFNSLIAGVSSVPAMWLYDVLAGSLSHAGTMDAFDKPSRFVHGSTFLGRSLLTFYTTNLGGGLRNYIQYQAGQGAYSPGGTIPVFATTGQAVTSLIDFNTPSLPKQYRRVSASHRALNAGESITVQIFVDRDPQSYVSGATAPDASITHAYAGGDPVPTKTVLNIPGHLIGSAAYLVVKLNAGTNQQTSPLVFWLSVEVVPPYTYQMELDCTRDGRTLDGRDDPLGLEAKDRVGMIRNAYENGQPLTLWTDFGESKLVNVADYEWRRTSPMNQGTSQQRADYEGFVKVTLTEVAI